MNHLRDSYERRRAEERGKRRVRGVIMLAGVLTTGALAARSWEPKEQRVVPVTRSVAERAEIRRLQADLERVRSELRTATAGLERWNHVFRYSHKYKIPADLAAAIYDTALDEKLDPELAFPLVKLESEFKETARSPVGAVGLTQLMLGTARFYQPTVTRDSLYVRETNLRIGFRYLRDLIREQRGDVQTALLVYNRGPAAVEAARELALDPSNGYDRIVLKGYRGKGVLD